MVVFSTIIMIRRAAAAAATVVRSISNRVIRTSRSYRSSSEWIAIPKAQSMLEEINRGGMGNYTHDDSVLFAIKYEEIRCASNNRMVEMEAPTELFPFKIEDNPGEETITLTRDYQGGEVIKVTVHMPDEDGEKKGRQSSIPLVVYVSKKDEGGPSFEFSVMAYPDEISINRLSVKKEPNAVASDHHQIAAYEGPDFTDLDENLQKAFQKSFLEMRGIKPSTANFLHEYMINKKKREYLTWLNNMKEFFAS